MIIMSNWNDSQIWIRNPWTKFYYGRLNRCSWQSSVTRYSCISQRDRGRIHSGKVLLVNALRKKVRGLPDDVLARKKMVKLLLATLRFLLDNHFKRVWVILGMQPSDVTNYGSACSSF